MSQSQSDNMKSKGKGQTPKEVPPQRQMRDIEPPDANLRRPFYSDPHWWGVIAAFLAVFATVYANYFQLNLYEETTHIENRAYLIIDNPQWDPKRADKAYFDIVNLGKTPAYKVAMRVKLVNGDSLREDPRHFLRNPGDHWFTLGPNVPSPQYVYFDTTTTGNKVFLYGKVTYLDKFDELHFTSFSYVYETGKLAFYPGFNDAD